jgi:competence protein ComEA
VAAVVAVLIGTRMLDSGPQPPPVRVGGGGGLESRAGRGPAIAPIYVHVAGAVRRPGVYRMRQGMRVAGAVEHAGGPLRTADLNAINLAARLQDGQQVVVIARRPAAAPVVAGADAPISLGSATAEQLDELDGIGPTLAERIVEYRSRQGGFYSLDQLAEVEGIGEKRLESLKQALTP